MVLNSLKILSADLLLESLLLLIHRVGLFPLVVMRFLQNVFHLNLTSSYWREGIVFQGGKGELVLIEWQRSANVIRAVYRTTSATNKYSSAVFSRSPSFAL